MTWIVLICVIVALIYIGRIIRIQDQKSHAEQLHQTTQLWSENFNLRLIADIDRLTQLSFTLKGNTNWETRLETMQTQARSVMLDRAEVLEIAVISDANRIILPIASPRPFGDITMAKDSAYAAEHAKDALAKTRRVGTTAFSEPYSLPIQGAPFVDLLVPVETDDQTLILAARLSLWILLRETTIYNPEYRFDLYYNDVPIIATNMNANRERISSRVTLHPLSSNIQLEVSRYATGQLTQNTLFWVITALGVFLIIAMLGIIRFNLRQNRIENALRAESALRKTVADSQLSGFQVTDLTGRIVYTNKTFNDLLDLDDSDSLIEQEPPYSYWPQDEDEAFRLTELVNGIAQGQINNASFEFRAKTAKGKSFWALLHISPMITVEGEQLGWLWTLSDISEIRQAQERLSAAHERFTRVLESMQDAVSVVDPTSNELLFSNSAYDKTFGHSTQGHTLALEKLQKLSAKEKARSPIICIENEDRWFSVRYRLIPWTKKRQARLQILSDVTEQHRNQLLLAEQQARSELNSRLVTMGEMAGSLAHELNQPLAAISNYAFVVENLMRKAGVPPEHEMFYAIERIGSQTKRAGGIIKRIRSFTRRSEPRMQTVAVQTLLGEVMELANIQARRHNAKLDYTIADDVTDVLCDEIMIEQVLLNLIKNGIEAAEGIDLRQPEVKLSIYHQTDYLVFEVSDNGSGIALEDKEQLFDPFFTTKSAGMGMGLNICRTIVELHHGRLTIEDNFPEGTTFKLMLPTAKAQNEEA